MNKESKIPSQSLFVYNNIIKITFSLEEKSTKLWN